MKLSNISWATRDLDIDIRKNLGVLLDLLVEHGYQINIEKSLFKFITLKRDSKIYKKNDEFFQVAYFEVSKGDKILYIAGGEFEIINCGIRVCLNGNYENSFFLDFDLNDLTKSRSIFEKELKKRNLI